MNNTTQHISLDVLDDPKIAMRSIVHDEDIEQLMSDMKVAGLIEPIVVRAVGDRFEIIAGHRRSTAARLLGWPTIEAKIVIADDDQAFQMRAMENTSRLDVNPVDDADFCREAMLRGHLDVARIAQLRNRSVEWVNQRLEIAEMPDYLKEYLALKRVTLGAALWINRITNESRRRYYANWAALNGVSISGAKRWHDLWACETGNEIFDETITRDDRGNPVFAAPTVRCAACDQMMPLNDADNVWIHPKAECPRIEEPAEAFSVSAEA